MMQYELIQMGQVEIQPTDANLDVGKARVYCKALQFVFGWDLSRGAKLHGCRIADVSRERFADGAVVGTNPDPHAERQTASMNEHSAHLPQRHQLVGKELEALLAQNCVKAGIRQSQIEGTALEPFDRRGAHGRRERPRHGDHSRIEVDPNDPSGRTDTLRSY